MEESVPFLYLPMADFEVFLEAVFLFFVVEVGCFVVAELVFLEVVLVDEFGFLDVVLVCVMEFEDGVWGELFCGRS